MYCDAVGNFTAEPSDRGGIRRVPLTGHRVGVVACTPEGSVLGSGLFANSVCPDQYAAACWAVLRAIEIAIQNGAELVGIKTQQVENLGSSTRNGYKGSRYLEIAREGVWQAKARCYFETLSANSINLAEFVARDANRSPGEFIWYPNVDRRGPESTAVPVVTPPGRDKLPPISSLIRS